MREPRAVLDKLEPQRVRESETRAVSLCMSVCVCVCETSKDRECPSLAHSIAPEITQAIRAGITAGVGLWPVFQRQLRQQRPNLVHVHVNGGPPAPLVACRGPRPDRDAGQYSRQRWASIKDLGLFARIVCILLRCIENKFGKVTRLLLSRRGAAYTSNQRFLRRPSGRPEKAAIPR